MPTEPLETRSRPRVLYIGHVARLSGAELALSRLIEALGDRVEAHVVLGEDGPLVDLLRERGVSVRVLALPEELREMRRDAVRVGITRPGHARALGRYIRRLAGVIRGVQPDIVHVTTLKSGAYGSLAARIAGVPTLWHVRDRLAADYLPPVTAWTMRQLVRTLPGIVVTNSYATLATLRPPRRGAFVVYNPITPRPEAREPRAPDGVFRVGIVGRIAPWKGIDVFLRAFATAFNGSGGGRATVVGAPLFGGDDVTHELEALAGELGISDRVEWRGFRTDVASELERLDALVHAATVPEPFGQTVLEGLAAGLPVIATREGGPAEIVQDEVSGLLYPSGDHEALAAQIRRIRDDEALRHRLSERGRKRAAEFDPEILSGEMLRIYDFLLAGR